MFGLTLPFVSEVLFATCSVAFYSRKWQYHVNDIICTLHHGYDYEVSYEINRKAEHCVGCFKWIHIFPLEIMMCNMLVFPAKNIKL